MPGRAARLRWSATAVVLTAIVLPALLASCSPAGAGPVHALLPPLRTRWLLTQSALAGLQADPVVRGLLGRSQLDEILRSGQQPVAGFSAMPVAAFASAAALTAAVTSGRLPAGTRAVLYDPEAWASTPESEQRSVVPAAARAAALAHAHRLVFIVAPALDLTAVLPPGGAGPRWQRFLALRLIAGLAATADMIDLQAQSLERDARVYARFVQAAAAQARGANPAVQVLAGLSTNPPGPSVTAGQLVAAIAASRAAVDGYWLNIPQSGPRCPSCGPTRPDIGISVLRAVL